MPHSPERQEGFHLSPALKRIIEAVVLAVATMTIQSCDGKNRDEATLQGSGNPKVSDKIRQGCASGVEIRSGLIECLDAMGVVTSSGD